MWNASYDLGQRYQGPDAGSVGHDIGTNPHVFVLVRGQMVLLEEKSILLITLIWERQSSWTLYYHVKQDHLKVWNSSRTSTLGGTSLVKFVAPSSWPLVQEKHPLVNLEETDIYGGIFTEGDGHIDPSSVTNAFADRAKGVVETGQRGQTGGHSCWLGMWCWEMLDRIWCVKNRKMFICICVDRSGGRYWAEDRGYRRRDWKLAWF